MLKPPPHVPSHILDEHRIVKNGDIIKVCLYVSTCVWICLIKQNLNGILGTDNNGNYIKTLSFYVVNINDTLSLTKVTKKNFGINLVHCLKINVSFKTNFKL